MTDRDPRLLHAGDGRGGDVRALGRVEEVGEPGRDLPVVLAGERLLEGVVALRVLAGLGLGLDPAEHPLLGVHRLVAGELGRLADELLADHLGEVRCRPAPAPCRSATGRGRLRRPSPRSRPWRSRRRRCRRLRSPGTTPAWWGSPITANGSKSIARKRVGLRGGGVIGQPAGLEDLDPHRPAVGLVDVGEEVDVVLVDLVVEVGVGVGARVLDERLLQRIGLTLVEHDQDLVGRHALRGGASVVLALVPRLDAGGGVGDGDLDPSELGVAAVAPVDVPLDPFGQGLVVGHGQAAVVTGGGRGAVTVRRRHRRCSRRRSTAPMMMTTRRIGP